MRLKRDNYLWALGFASFALLSAFVGQSVLIPTENTSAVEDSSVTEVSVGITPIIAVTVTGADETGTLPIEVVNNELGTGVVNVEVSTNDPSGYSLFITTNRADHALTQNGITDRIHALEGETAVADFPESHWGYSVDGGNTYYPVQPNTDNPAEYPGVIADAPRAKVYNGPATKDDTEVTIGARVKVNIYGGTYSNTVVFTAIPNISVNQAIAELGD